jgi:hypothetical protein
MTILVDSCLCVDAYGEEGSFGAVELRPHEVRCPSDVSRGSGWLSSPAGPRLRFWYAPLMSVETDPVIEGPLWGSPKELQSCAA